MPKVARRKRCKSCGSFPKRGKDMIGGGTTDDEADSFIFKEQHMGLSHEERKQLIYNLRAKEEERKLNPPPRRVYTPEEVQKQVDAARRGNERHHPGQPFDEAYIRSQFYTGGKIRKGRGWEEELAKAQVKDKTNQEDIATSSKLKNQALRDLESKFKGKAGSYFEGGEKNRASDGGYKYSGGKWYQNTYFGLQEVPISSVPTSVRRQAGML